MPSNPLIRCRSVADLLDELARLDVPYVHQGVEYELTVADHGVQCAAGVADAAPDDIELHIAALVHDIGYALGAGDRDHGPVAGNWIRPLLGPRIAAAVAWHDIAERHLVATDRRYRRHLHPSAGRRSLVPLTPAESARFFRHDGAGDAIILARANDQSCAMDHRPATLDSWFAVIELQARAVRDDRSITQVARS